MSRMHNPWIVALVLFCSCAHQNIASRDEGYRRMQELEAELARSEARRTQVDRCTDAYAAEVGTLCDRSRALCTESEAIAEADARARCRRAREMCTAARDGGATECLRDPPS
jgi:hypothetical protein